MYVESSRASVAVTVIANVAMTVTVNVAVTVSRM